MQTPPSVSTMKIGVPGVGGCDRLVDIVNETGNEQNQTVRQDIFLLPHTGTTVKGTATFAVKTQNNYN